MVYVELYDLHVFFMVGVMKLCECFLFFFEASVKLLVSAVGADIVSVFH